MKFPTLKKSWVVGGALGLVAVVGAAYAAGYWVAQDHYMNLLGDSGPIRQNDTRYPLVSPLLAYRMPEATDLGEYTGLKSAFLDTIEQATTTGVASRVSVYFRDLGSSEWIGVNQDSTYYPASLLKVPVLLAYYKAAEGNPATLSEPIVYQAISGETFDTPSTLVPGKSYSIEQLIEAMIIESDNGATQTLLAHLDGTALDRVYADLGISGPGSSSATYELSARTYGLFFRVLYNATYLSPEYSEKALALLGKATFAQGLVAGVPDATLIAHKFGEHIIAQGSTPVGVELHDCGIVYYPRHPYLLCVMTSAKDVSNAYQIIKTLSNTAYAAVAQQYGTRH